MYIQYTCISSYVYIYIKGGINSAINEVREPSWTHLFSRQVNCYPSGFVVVPLTIEPEQLIRFTDSKAEVMLGIIQLQKFRLSISNCLQRFPNCHSSTFMGISNSPICLVLSRGVTWCRFEHSHSILCGTRIYFTGLYLILNTVSSQKYYWGNYHCLYATTRVWK